VSALHPTRRAVLRASVAAVAGFAGCSTRDPDPEGTPTPTAGEPAYDHSVAPPESAVVRNPEGEPAVRSSARSPEEGAYESTASWTYEDWLVTTDEQRDALEFAAAAEGAAAAREFAAATDLSGQTLLVHQYDVDECLTRRLDRLEWGTGFSCGDRECAAIFLTYERVEAGDGCAGTDTALADGPPYSDESHANEATFVRIPDAIGFYGRFGTSF